MKGGQSVGIRGTDGADVNGPTISQRDICFPMGWRRDRPILFLHRTNVAKSRWWPSKYPTRPVGTLRPLVLAAMMGGSTSTLVLEF